uniref:HMG box domain-containing protein n=1 Tax=Panagrolaimus sp. PS1159 TaxID=55785 RepID=A0AC35FNH7_9BILA
MNRLFGKLHISSLLQSNVILSRGFASTKLPTGVSGSEQFADIGNLWKTVDEISKVKLPKPTPNAYALFTKLNMQHGISGRVQFPVIAEAWKTYPDEEKMKLKDKAAKLRNDAIAEFTKLPKEEQQAEFDEVAKKRADLKKNRRRRAFLKFCRETNRPTRPLNGFMLCSKKAAEEWNKMCEDEKKPYLDKYNQLLEIYKVDYEKWYKVYGKNYEALKKVYE